jgi:RNA 2',3'-cyclic 3'-phosphodiesterase
MRLFVALDIDDAVRVKIAHFLEGVSGFAPEARWVRAESLHVTLKFIGEKSEKDAGEISQALARIKATVIDISLRGYGFFPTARSPRVFWIGVETDEKLNALASAVDSTLAALGAPREEHAFNAHVTLARGGNPRSGNKQRGKHPTYALRRLEEKLAPFPAPEFGTMTAREFFLYQSHLSPHGSKYTKLERFELGPA